MPCLFLVSQRDPLCSCCLCRRQHSYVVLRWRVLTCTGSPSQSQRDARSSRFCAKIFFKPDHWTSWHLWNFEKDDGSILLKTIFLSGSSFFTLLVTKGKTHKQAAWFMTSFISWSVLLALVSKTAATICLEITCSHNMLRWVRLEKFFST